MRWPTLEYSVVLSHPFEGGSEESSFVAASTCLRPRGYRLRWSDGAEDFFWSAARGNVDAIVEWLKAHSAREEADP
jgi:prophage maintenance system killer protein